MKVIASETEASKDGKPAIMRKYPSSGVKERLVHYGKAFTQDKSVLLIPRLGGGFFRIVPSIH